MPCRSTSTASSGGGRSSTTSTATARARDHHGQRARHPRRPEGQPQPRVARRDPQLLDPRAQRHSATPSPGAVPGCRSRPTSPARYVGQCKEFCGLSHANMRAEVVVAARPATSSSWTRQQQEERGHAPTDPVAQAGLVVFEREVRGVPPDQRRQRGRRAAPLFVSKRRPEPHPPDEPRHVRQRPVRPLRAATTSTSEFNRPQLEAWLREPTGETRRWRPDRKPRHAQPRT